VAFAADGKLLVTSDLHQTVRVWDATTGRMIRDIQVLQTRLCALALSPDGNELATSESTGQLRLWDVMSGRELRRWHGVPSEVSARLTFSPNGRFLAAIVRPPDKIPHESSTFINLWEIGARSERRRRLSGDWFRLLDLKFSPDGTTLAAASLDVNPRNEPARGSIRLIDLATSQERKRLAVVGLENQLVAFSPDMKLVAVLAGDRRTIGLYDLATGQERRLPLRGEPTLQPGPPGDCLAFSPDGSVLAVGVRQGLVGSTISSLARIQLCDVARGEPLREIAAHQHWVSSVSFSPDGKTLASTGAEPVIRLWDVTTGRESFPQPGHRSAIDSLLVSPADGTVFTRGYDGTIRRWDPARGQELGVVASLATNVDAMAIAPDGQSLLVGDSVGARLALWSIAERREIRRFPRMVETSPVRHVAFSPDGKTVASERRIWDATTGEVLVAFRDRDEQNNRNANFIPIFYSPDGRQVVTIENEGARVWDVASGQEARWAVRARIYNDHVALSGDGRYLATGGLVVHLRASDPPIRLWELISGQEVATLVGHETSTCGLSFSPNGRLLASCSNDATVRVWDVATGRELRRFTGHRGAVHALSFTPDGRSVISGSEDGTGLVWDVTDLQGNRQAEAPLARETLQAHWNELAGEDARAAHRAAWAMSVPSAVAFLREHLRPVASPDANGIPAVIGPIAPLPVLRSLRAIAALERVGSPEARAVLEWMARGNLAAIETREATAALHRLSRPHEIQVGPSVR
jgi:WD40 repeat protein